MLSLGHAFTDLNQGGVPALLPALKDAYGLTFAQVGTILFVLNLASSVIQPVIGYWSDRTQQRWLLPAGPVLTAVGMAMLGMASNYRSILFAVAVCGVGVAAYHPEGARAAYHVAGGRRATGMAVYSVGGNIGYSLGPPYALGLVAWFGLRGLGYMLLPTALIAAGLVALMPRLAACESAGAGSSSAAGRDGATPRPSWYAQVPLIGIVTVRSWIQLGLLTFIPFYYAARSATPGIDNGTLLFTFLAAGAVGTLVGGPLADRIGARPVLLGSMAALLPLQWALLHARGYPALALLAVAGFAIVCTFTLTLVLSQELMPGRLGAASGLIIGFAIGMGGIGAAVLGALADAWGVETMLRGMLVLPLLGLGFTWLLPRPASGAAPATPARRRA